MRIIMAKTVSTKLRLWRCVLDVNFMQEKYGTQAILRHARLATALTATANIPIGPSRFTRGKLTLPKWRRISSDVTLAYLWADIADSIVLDPEDILTNLCKYRLKESRAYAPEIP